MVSKKPNKLKSASKKMYSNTKKQADKIGKKLDDSIGTVYTSESNKDFVSFEPKKNNRWMVHFPDELEIPSWAVKHIDRPAYPFNAGDKFTMSLYDPIGPSMSKVISTFLEKQQPFKLVLKLLDPVGLAVENWNFTGCLITKAKWSDLDYSNDEPCSILLEITYTKITLDE